MASELVNDLNAFLDLQMQRMHYASFALSVAYDLLAEENSNQTFRENMAAIKAGETAAYFALKRKVFPAATLDEITDSPNEWLEKLEPQAAVPALADTSALDELMELPTEDGRTQLEALANKQGVSSEEFRAKIFGQFGKDTRNRQLAQLGEPSVHRFLLRRFALHLDEVVEELERLDELGLEWDFIPPHFQVLLSEAHEAALFGHTVAAAVLFGVALEEALKRQLGRDRCENLSEGIKLALRSGLLDRPSPAYDSVRKIQRWRNDAAHDPQSFLVKRVSARDLLDHARFALVHLFSEKAK